MRINTHAQPPMGIVIYKQTFQMVPISCRIRKAPTWGSSLTQISDHYADTVCSSMIPLRAGPDR